jgi:hypothetical protein
MLFRFSEMYGLVVPSRLGKRGVRVVTNVECGMRWTLRHQFDE